MTQRPGVGAVRLLPESTGDRCFACGCRPGSIFSALDAASLMELDHLRQTSIYPTGAPVFLEDEQPTAVYCVGAGSVKLSRTLPDGRAVVLGIARSGEVLGVRPLLLGLPHDVTAETLDETRLCFIPKTDFLAFLARNWSVSLRLAQKLSAELGEAYQQVFSVTVKPTAERLAEVLLALCQTHGELVPDGISLATNMCQEELAELLGTSRRSLVRALAGLRHQGAIECRRRIIIVRDRAALKKSVGSIGRGSVVPSAPRHKQRRTRQLAQS